MDYQKRATPIFDALHRDYQNENPHHAIVTSGDFHPVDDNEEEFFKYQAERWDD